MAFESFGSDGGKDPSRRTPTAQGGSPQPLARQTIVFAGGNWTEVPFKLTLPAGVGTECEGLAPDAARKQGVSCHDNGTYVSMDGGWGRNSASPGGMSDLTAHICVKCGGQFSIRYPAATTANAANTDHTAATEVRVGFASVMPGAWGRYKGTAARAESVSALHDMGVKMMRVGGSFACDPTMAWPAWRGPRWKRPLASHQGDWVHDDVSGWGPFEAMEMCDAMGGVVCVITLFAGIEGESGHARERCLEQNLSCDLHSDAYGDLVEYIHGDHTTEWGQRRIEDGHPAPCKHHSRPHSPARWTYRARELSLSLFLPLSLRPISLCLSLLRFLSLASMFSNPRWGLIPLHTILVRISNLVLLAPKLCGACFPTQTTPPGSSWATSSTTLTSPSRLQRWRPGRPRSGCRRTCCTTCGQKAPATHQVDPASCPTPPMLQPSTRSGLGHVRKEIGKGTSQLSRTLAQKAREGTRMLTDK